MHVDSLFGFEPSKIDRTVEVTHLYYVDWFDWRQNHIDVDAVSMHVVSEKRVGLGLGLKKLT
jgi:hypothetical protein